MGYLGNPKAGNTGHVIFFGGSCMEHHKETGKNWDHKESDGVIGGHVESIRSCGMNIILKCF